jgi:hypothetical protein
MPDQLKILEAVKESVYYWNLVNCNYDFEYICMYIYMYVCIWRNYRKVRSVFDIFSC